MQLDLSVRRQNGDVIDLKQYNQVCVERRPSDLNMTLPTFAANRMRRVPGIDRYLLKAPALSSKPAARRSCCRPTRQTDGRTNTQSLHRSCTMYIERVFRLDIHRREIAHCRHQVPQHRFIRYRRQLLATDWNANYVPAGQQIYPLVTS